MKQLSPNFVIFYRCGLPEQSPVNLSEDLHCYRLLYPYVHPIFLDCFKDYEVRLPNMRHLSCVIDDIPLLVSEIKPLGYTPLQKVKGFIKVQLHAKKSINNQLSAKGGPAKAALFTNMGIYV